MFNKGAEEILGYRADEIKGHKEYSDIYPPGKADDVMRRLRSPEEGGAGRLAPVRLDLVSAQDEPVPVVLSAAIIYEGGREHAIVITFSDLREQQQMEMELRRQLVETEKLAAIAELSGAAAHELNQPLTVISAYAELLENALPPADPSRPAIETIAREVERMAAIVRKIGHLTHYETRDYVGSAKILDLDRATGIEADSISQEVIGVATTGAETTRTEQHTRPSDEP